MKGVLFLILFAACSLNGFSQSDPDKEIIVYFADGIQRTAANRHSTIRSNAISSVLNFFSMDSTALTCAFPRFDEKDTIRYSEDGAVVKEMNLSRVFRLRVPNGIDREKVIERLKRLPEVVFADLNGRIEDESYSKNSWIPPTEDDYYQHQWSLKNTGQHGGRVGADINAEAAWSVFTGSSSTVIGIIEAQGADLYHPDLQSKVIGASSDHSGSGIGNSHSSHVAGIAAAATNNFEGIAGVDWNARMIIKAIGSGEVNDDVTVYAKITQAVDAQAKILNHSWKTIPIGRYSTLIRAALAYASRYGRCTNVVATGNTGETGNVVQYPSGFEQAIIAVAATDRNDLRASFSSYQSYLDLVAPGKDITSCNYSTQPFVNNCADGSRMTGYWCESGTSQAAPHVTGVASLMLGYKPSLEHEDIENILKLSSDKVRTDVYTYNSSGFNSQMGYGRINARKALDFLRSPYTLQQRSETGGTDLGPSSLPNIIFIGTTNSAMQRHAFVHEVRRTVTFSPTQNPIVWGRGAATTGAKTEIYNGQQYLYDMGWCEVVPGTVTATSAVLRTYCYYVIPPLAPAYWYPTAPANVTFNYTVLGTPIPLSADIEGPSCVNKGQSGTWTAFVSGGTGSYTYSWTRNGVFVGSGASVTLTVNLNFTLGLTVTSGSETVVRSQYVTTCSGGGGGGCENAAIEAGSLVPPCFAKTIGKETEIPREFDLSQNYPNPFNPTTTIRFALPEQANATLRIYNLQGQLVRTLFGHYLGAGYYDSVWNGNDDAGKEVASGVYVYRLEAGRFIQSKKMTLVK